MRGILIERNFTQFVVFAEDSILSALSKITANQSRLNAWKLTLPAVLIVLIIFALDLICSVGFLLYAFISPTTPSVIMVQFAMEPKSVLRIAAVSMANRPRMAPYADQTPERFV